MTHSPASAKKAIHSTSPIYWFNQSVATYGPSPVFNAMVGHYQLNSSSYIEAVKSATNEFQVLQQLPSNPRYKEMFQSLKNEQKQYVSVFDGVSYVGI